MDPQQHLLVPLQFLQNLDALWTFFLLVTRHAAMIVLMPGIGMGERGEQIRIPAILFISYAAMLQSPHAGLPADWALLFLGIISEVMFGMILGMVPSLIIAGLQTAAQLSTTTMGLGASQMIDPTMGISVSSLARIVGDVMVIVFLLLGGHHVVLYAASGVAGEIIPGTFMITENTLQLLISRTGEIFLAGVMLSAPVIVALLLTQFVMGLISKAVPTVNIFIISFPLTIGIGMVLTILSIPEIYVYMEQRFNNMESDVNVIVEGAERRSSPRAGQPFDARVNP